MNAIAIAIVLILLIAALAVAIASATGTLVAQANLRRAGLREIPTAESRRRELARRAPHPSRAAEQVWADPSVPLAQSVLPERWEHRGADDDRRRAPSELPPNAAFTVAR
ncbi:hypothetical protein ACT3TZ_12025 [Brachybacterium sp. AOP25-B2-12]|uniref:hypothetical protein n=1 Tax=Brachybacterium sp. AOP25-B2-12 TaxID=3457710 RepID=UPI00403403D2